jgi:C4-dicarboxylate-specific signal transduction histidine kinase
MVAGIAHEVNQPLYSILNFAKASRNVLAAEGEPNREDLREWNEEIAAAASRTGEIIARLRSFVRRTEMQCSSADLNEIVRESIELMAFETRRLGIAVRPELCESPFAVNVDRVQIQQVVVNLLRNACEAMAGGPAPAGMIVVRTALVDRGAEISVADRGPGLPAGGDLQIFDAFVTTKPDGLGMGLAISKTIVEAHGGSLSGASNPEGGATFRFTLPVVKVGQRDVE